MIESAMAHAFGSEQKWDESTVLMELGDSLDMVELVMYLEEASGKELDLDLPYIIDEMTVAQLRRLIESA